MNNMPQPRCQARHARKLRWVMRHEHTLSSWRCVISMPCSSECSRCAASEASSPVLLQQHLAKLHEHMHIAALTVPSARCSQPVPCCGPVASRGPRQQGRYLPASSLALPIARSRLSATSSRPFTKPYRPAGTSLPSDACRCAVHPAMQPAWPA